MEGLSKYDVISVAYRSRLLFRTDAEYREALGVSFETVINNRDSERDMAMYYDSLNRRAGEYLDESLPLTDLVTDYIVASDYYLSLDWGDRSQMASRKKFCRMLFRLYATAGKELSNDEIYKFKIKNDDSRLLEAFFPDGFDEAPAVDICFTVLMAFGVVKPWTGSTRGHDIRDRETLAAIDRLRELISLLKADMPRLGSMEKPLVFDEWLQTLERAYREQDSLQECTPLWLASSLMVITDVCLSLVIAEEQRQVGEKLQGLYMPGIWVDDSDGGKSRFWIFPDNMLFAFCYTRQGASWEMTPYEFRIMFADKPDHMDSFIMIHPRGNLDFILSSDKAVSNEQLVSGKCDQEIDELSGDISRLILFEGALQFPAWFNWREWKRLEPDEDLYRLFRSVISDVYDTRSPYSVLFLNTAPELTDSTNNLVGRDGKYIYLYDRRPGRFGILERNEGHFTYEDLSCRDDASVALFELSISTENPLYALPVKIKHKKFHNAELNRLAEILTDADNISYIYIMHSGRVKCPRLVFPAYCFSIALDMDILKEIGVIKFTERP